MRADIHRHDLMLANLHLDGDAIREIDSVPLNQDMEKLVAQEHATQKELLQNPHLYFYLTAFDPDRWEIIRYHLWQDAAHAPKLGSDCIQTYDVLHVSEPVIAADSAA